MRLCKHPPKTCEEGGQREVNEDAAPVWDVYVPTPPKDIALNAIVFLLPDVKQLIGDNTQRRN